MLRNPLKKKFLDPCFLTINNIYFPAALCPFRYDCDCECEWSSVGAEVLIKASDVDSFLIRAKTLVSGTQGWTVVVGHCDLDGNSFCGCCGWIIWG